MKSKLKKIFKEKRTIIISILLGLILIGLIIFICTKVFHKDKEITPEDPTVSEFENYLKDAIKPFNEDTIKDFISSTDNLVEVDNIYWGATYSDDIDINLKVLYTLNRMFYTDSDLVTYMSNLKMFDNDNELGEVKLSLKFINKALKAKFNSTEITKNTVITDGFYKGINAVICGEEYCIIPISKMQNKKINSDGLYTSSVKNASLEKINDGYELTTDYYYYEAELSGSMSYGIYDNAFKEKVYCETSLPEIQILDGNLPDRCNVGNYNKIKYTFDKNYHFIKSERV